MPLGFLKKVIRKFNKMDRLFLEEMEQTLIQADVGLITTEEILEKIQRKNPKSRDETKELISEIMAGIIQEGELCQKNGLGVILFCGVNGVGKTTSLAKIAHYLKKKGKKCKLVAADTYRAAGIEQLEVWAEKLKIPVIKQFQGSDPGAVVFDAINSGLSDRDDYLLVDTAGRMHTREDLMREIVKVYNVVLKKIPEDHIEVLVVLDATTGQNGFNQAVEFKKYLPVQGAFLAKYDSSFKAGIIIRISKELNIPIKFVGTGEKIEDMDTFRKKDYITNIF
ncbi:MAG: signal recognition particle-docking protein FtsY [Spirochaetes bacterium]|nr:signal recognition particle-docking protein FtsY [Spirochaetota bacterium]